MSVCTSVCLPSTLWCVGVHKQDIHMLLGTLWLWIRYIRFRLPQTFVNFGLLSCRKAWNSFGKQLFLQEFVEVLHIVYKFFVNNTEIPHLFCIQQVLLCKRNCVNRFVAKICVSFLVTFQIVRNVYMTTLC